MALLTAFRNLVGPPVLLVAGAPVLHRLLRHAWPGPGLCDKQRGWTHPAYFLFHNPLIRALTWPSEQLWDMYQG